jgi:hypothetical protein
MLYIFTGGVANAGFRHIKHLPPTGYAGMFVKVRHMTYRLGYYFICRNTKSPYGFNIQYGLSNLKRI